MKRKIIFCWALVLFGLALIFIKLPGVSFISSTASAISSNPDEQQLKTDNDKFHTSHSQADHDKLLKDVKTRFEALQNDLPQYPELVAQQVISKQTYESLPNDAKEYAEHKITIDGTTAFFHADSFDTGVSTEIPVVKDSKTNEVYQLNYTTNSPPSLGVGSHIQTDAVAFGKSVLVDTTNVNTNSKGSFKILSKPKKIQPEVEGAKQLGIASSKTAVLGAVTKNILVIPMLWTDNQKAPFSISTLQQLLYSNKDTVNAPNVKDFYREASFGQYNLNFTLIDSKWNVANELPSGKILYYPTSCDRVAISTDTQNAAWALALKKQFDPAAYDLVIIVFPKIRARPCNDFFGWAYIGLTGGGLSKTVWVNGNSLTSTFAHEMGHVFGLGHAAYRFCTNLAYGENDIYNCSYDEYGDSYDMMGNRSQSHPRHFNAPHQRALLFNNTLQQISTTPGTTISTYLYPLEVNTSGLKTLKVQAGDRLFRGKCDLVMHQQYYYISYRQGYTQGLDFNTGAGIDINLWDGIPCDQSQQLYFPYSNANGTTIPSSASSLEYWYLSPGKIFHDYYNNIMVKANSLTSSGASVTVTIGRPPLTGDTGGGTPSPLPTSFSSCYYNGAQQSCVLNGGTCNHAAVGTCDSNQFCCANY